MIALLTTPLGRAVLALVTALIGLGVAYWLGRSDQARMCDAAAVRLELTQARADLARMDAAKRDATAATERLAAERTRDLEKIDAFEATLAGRDACGLSDDDARRLRDILGDGVPGAPRRP